MKQLHRVPLIAFCMVILLSAFLSVGITQGRYDNGIIWRGVYEPPTVEIETELLSEEGYQVIMADWEIDPMAAQSQRTYNIRATARNGKAEGSLSCQVENDARYLTAWLDTDSLIIDEDGETFSLTLSLTKEFQKDLEKEWSRRQKSISSGNVSSGNVSSGDVSSGDAADSGLLPTSFVVSVTWTGKEEQKPSLQARFVVKMVCSANATVSGSDAGAGSYGQETTVSAAAKEAFRILSATDSFAWDEWFGLTVSVPDGVAELELQYSGMAFPRGAKFKVNSGEVMVVGENQEIMIPQSGAGEQLILFHMEKIPEVYKTNQIVLSITALDKDGRPLGFDYRTLSADAVSLSVDTKEVSQMIEKDGEMTVTTQLKEEDLSWYIEYFTKDENEKPVYVTRDDQFGLDVQFYQNVDNSEKRILMISNGRKLAPAGSYHLVMQKHYAGVEVAREELSFFIHY